MNDKLEKAVAIITLTIGIVSFALIIVAGLSSTSDREAKSVKACEERGGVLLEKVYRVGKVTNRRRACIRRDAIVEMEDGF